MNREEFAMMMSEEREGQFECKECGDMTNDPIYYKGVWCGGCFEETKAR